MHYNDQDNPLFHLADNFINQTNRSIFLTGKAGTGKTTFLKHIKENTVKKTVVVAPTGVAAINAGGVTMHSFFQLPFGPFLPEANSPLGNGNQYFHNRQSLFEKIRFNKTKRQLLNDLELLIIDEVSMVRADMLDAVDTILKHFRRKPQAPFGGVQVLFIGDLFQLPPVVKNEDWETLRQYYKSPFFFDALALRDQAPLCIELKKIYRQKDDEFVQLLNQVRNNELEENSLELLNKHYKPDFSSNGKDHYITLTTHNYQADEINNRELNRLPGDAKIFKAYIDGDFQENAFPAEESLKLKPGAQVMFIKNDKGEERRYYNGKIGNVASIHGDNIVVEFPEEKNQILLEKEEWENVRYKYNQEEKKINEEVLGTFRQYPIRLAWAITIHKSQGLTFEKAVIDAGQSFSAGQVYVALSRLRSMKGMVLLSKINPHSVKCDPDVVTFLKNQPQITDLQKQLTNDRKSYIVYSLSNSFYWDNLLFEFQDHFELYKNKNVKYRDKAVDATRDWINALRYERETANKFLNQLNQLLKQGEQSYPKIAERVKAACDFFNDHMKVNIFDKIEAHINETREARSVKKYAQSLHLLRVALKQKKYGLEQALLMAEALAGKKDEDKLFKELEAKKKREDYGKMPKVKKPKKGETKLISLEMFQKGKTIQEIANERNLVRTTIESHLISFIPTGEVEVDQIVPPEKLNKILPLVEQESSASEVMSQLGDGFTYSDIKAARAYLELQQKVD